MCSGETNKTVVAMASPATETKTTDMGRHTRYYDRQDLEPFNLLDHPVWVFDIERKAMWWANDASLRIWNADSLASLLARDFTDMSEATQRRLQEYLIRFEKGSRARESWTFYPNNEGPVTCYVTMSGMYIENGRMVMLIEGELSKAQETIDQSALRAVELLRHLPVPVGQFDASGKVMDQNPESLHVFGGCKQHGECKTDDKDKECDCECCSDDIGCNLLARFVDNDQGKQVLDQVMNQGLDYHDEVQQNTKQGLRWFALKLRRSKDPVKGTPVLLYSARDITALIETKNNMVACKIAKKEADPANMAKSEFVAVMAHEIRTPLYQVLGFLELMSETSLNAKQKEFVKLMENSATGLMAIINDLLDYTKLEAGKMKMEKIPIDVKDSVTASLQVMVPKANARGLSVISNLDDALCPVLGDPGRLQQLLLNFLQNAVKFTHEGSITLTVTRQPDDVSGRVILKFVVADTGIGISPEHHRVIFDKYQQADPAVARKCGGTGLGLAICKNIVETLGGTIGVHSVLKEGSQFWFQIPFERAKIVKPVSVTAEIPKSVRSLHVLVAEDNKVNQKLVVSVLKRLGHTSTVVENGLLAVEAVQKGRYDVVLMDVQMPEMDGIEATQLIRKNGWSHDLLPVLGLTADFRTVDLPMYRSIGMNDCLGKPIKMKDLQVYLNSAVSATCHSSTQAPTHSSQPLEFRLAAVECK